MTFTIGRATALSDPYTWNQSGDFVDVEGTLHDTSIYVIKALRQQLLGYVGNRDEPVVPVTSSSDSHIDGFYRVLNADVNVPRGGHALKQYQWSVSLERVSDYAAPLIESRLLAPGIRSNDTSITETENGTVKHSWWIPETAGGLGNFSSSPILASADGDLMRLLTGATNKDRIVQYFLTSADWYSGACLLEVDYADDGVFRPVVGRQVINLADDARWRLSNGVVRFSLPSTTELHFAVERWTGAAWSTGKEFAFTRTSDDRELVEPDTLTALRNGPQDVTVRLTAGGADEEAYRIDLRLVRGSRLVEVAITQLIAGTPGAADFQLGVDTVEAATELDLTGVSSDDAGIYATAEDADDNVYTIVTPQVYTADLVNGRVGLGNETTARFGFGLANITHDNSGGVAYTAAQASRIAGQEYFGAMGETVRVVER